MVQKQKTSFGPVQPLDGAKFQQLTDIGRCLHTDDVQMAHKGGKLVPQWLTNSAVRLRQKVLWFAPCKSLDEHNEFGNATFVISWKSVVDKLGPYLYLIDQAIYNNRAYTRVVFTRNNYDSQLTRVALEAPTSVMKYEFNSYYHASSCRCKFSFGPHELQIAIEVGDADAAWLLRNCSLRGNNHTSANTPLNHVVTRYDGQQKKYVSYKCFKYNTAQNRECPNAFDRASSDAILTAMGFSMNTGANSQPIRQSNNYPDSDIHITNLENSLAQVHLNSNKVTSQHNYSVRQSDFLDDKEFNYLTAVLDDNELQHFPDTLDDKEFKQFPHLFDEEESQYFTPSNPFLPKSASPSRTSNTARFSTANSFNSSLPSTHVPRSTRTLYSPSFSTGSSSNSSKQTIPIPPLTHAPRAPSTPSSFIGSPFNSFKPKIPTHPSNQAPTSTPQFESNLHDHRTTTTTDQNDCCAETCACCFSCLFCCC